MEAGIFLGRFHPVIVHLPIGFLLLAVFLEIYSRKNKSLKLEPAISISLFLGFLSGIISIYLGFLISSEGGYENQLLTWHKISGITLTLISGLCWLIKSGKIKIPDGIYLFLTGIMVISVISTGHVGGMLTHGNDFLLSSSPDFIKKLFNYKNEKSLADLPPVPDSVKIYSHLIEPILEKRCNGCHNQSEKKSGLALNTYDDLMKGSAEGLVIQAGNPVESELFRRITLSRANPGFMPPRGNPLSYGQIRLIEWWIENGASQSDMLGDRNLTAGIKHVLLNEYEYDASPKSFLEIHEVPMVEKEKLEFLEKNNFTVAPLSKNSSFLDVQFNSDVITIKNLEALQAVSEQITWLDLRNSGVTDEMMNLIAKLPNITKLRLDGNPVTDNGIEMLANLSNLEIISLYNTKAGKDCIKSLIKLPYLKKIYLAQTRVYKEDIAYVREINPDLEIVLDLHFSESEKIN